MTLFAVSMSKINLLRSKMAPFRQFSWKFFGQKTKVNMFAKLEFLCHLAHDVKKLFSVRGKLTISSELSSNLSDT